MDIKIDTNESIIYTLGNVNVNRFKYGQPRIVVTDKNVYVDSWYSVTVDKHISELQNGTMKINRNDIQNIRNISSRDPYRLLIWIIPMIIVLIIDTFCVVLDLNRDPLMVLHVPTFCVLFIYSYINYLQKKLYMVLYCKNENIGVNIEYFTLEELNTLKSILFNNEYTEEIVIDKSKKVAECNSIYMNMGKIEIYENHIQFNGKFLFRNDAGRIHPQSLHNKIIPIDNFEKSYNKIKPAKFMQYLSFSILGVLLTIIVLMFNGYIEYKPGLEDVVIDTILFFAIILLSGIVYLSSYLFGGRYIILKYKDGNIAIHKSDYYKEQIETLKKTIRRNNSINPLSSKNNLSRKIEVIKPGEKSETKNPTIKKLDKVTLVKSNKPSKSDADTLREFAKLRDDGIISNEEFQQIKDKLIVGQSKNDKA